MQIIFHLNQYFIFMIPKQIFRTVLQSVRYLNRNPLTKVSYSVLKVPKFRFSEEVKETIIKKSNTQKKQFKAETKKLLDIVAKSLYTDHQVFIRELLSNSSDALEKQRFQVQSDQNLVINVQLNGTKKQIIIQDNGIGMSKEELMDNLGTIARSGSKLFVESLQKETNIKGNPQNIIGQFGVGFYSSFIVADFVEVISRTQGGQAYSWTSDGSGVYQISEVSEFDLQRGTRIILNLKTESQKFSELQQVKSIIQKYSNFINFPINLNGDRMNIMKAIWTRDKRQITEEQYKKFYAYLVGNDYAEYFSKIHYTADVPLSIKSIIYIPKTHSEKFGMGQQKGQIHLYSKKILIKKDCKEVLIPSYLRFVKGIVDCEDIPLNISRQNYQDSALMSRLKNVITKRILKHLKEESQKNPEQYNRWFQNFLFFFKEGLIDYDNRKEVLELNRYQTNLKDGHISLKEYLALRKQKQDRIFYMFTSNKQTSKNSPYLEPFSKSNIPVLLVNTPIDQMVFKELDNYEGNKYVNIETTEQDLSKYLESVEHDESKGIKAQDLTTFPLWIKNQLQPYVSKVVVSKKNLTGPGLIISQMSNSMRQMKHMREMIQEKTRSGEIREDLKNLTFEINPNDQLLAGLNNLRKNDPQSASLIIQQIFDNCCAQASLEMNTKQYINRINKIMLKMIKNTHHNAQVSQAEVVQNEAKRK